VFEKALVSELKEGTYYSRIYLTSAGRHIEVDSRPSDAIALALRFHKPIFVARSLMEGQNAVELGETGAKPIVEKVRGITVQEINQKLAEYFHLPTKDGVLVSEVRTEGNSADLKRGDVILAVEDEKVLGLADFKRKIDRRNGAGVSLHVLREDKEMVVHFQADR
jgi:S1-C subfamily serine protease